MGADQAIHPIHVCELTSLQQRTAAKGERTSEHLYIPITPGFPNSLFNAKDQV